MTTKAVWQRIPLIVSFPETAKYTETYGFAGNSGRVNLEGQLLCGADAPSKTVYVFMHPTSTLQLLPMPTALADAGLHVLCAASRYPKNDTALIMEKVAIDLGKWLDYARGELGYEKVVLVGWSGGGSLSLFYQAQAENPTITHTPAGDEVNLVEAGLKPADGVIFIAAHLSRAETLTEWLDPSVLDELNPDVRDPEFDIYSPDCPHQPPYSKEFIERFRAAQIARNRKITQWALDMLAEPEAPRFLRTGTCLRRPPHHVRRALVRRHDRPERPSDRQELHGRPAHCERRPGRACSLHDAAFLAFPVELRPVERQGSDERGADQALAGTADREQCGRGGSGDAQSDNSRGAGDREQGIHDDPARHPLLPRPAGTVEGLHRPGSGLEPPPGVAVIAKETGA